MMNKDRFAVYDTRFGKMIIYYRDYYIYKMEFREKIDIRGDTNFISDIAYKQIEEYFDKKRKTFDFKIKINATPFQKKVYQALQKIEYGKCKTYKEIALDISNPFSYRAIGNALNKNPLPIIIPCHRVIKSNGKIGEYAYGVFMKKALLEIEDY